MAGEIDVAVGATYTGATATTEATGAEESAQGPQMLKDEFSQADVM